MPVSDAAPVWARLTAGRIHALTPEKPIAGSQPRLTAKMVTSTIATT